MSSVRSDAGSFGSCKVQQADKQSGLWAIQQSMQGTTAHVHQHAFRSHSVSTMFPLAMWQLRKAKYWLAQTAGCMQSSCLVIAFVHG
jgi:hypothetical protein